MKFIYYLICSIIISSNLTSLEPELFSPPEFSFDKESNDFFEFNNEVYVIGNDGTHGIELCKFNSEKNSLEIIKDITENGDSNPFIFAKTTNKLFFITKETDSKITKLWSTDGTENGTILLEEDYSRFSITYFKSSTLVHNDKLYFINKNYENRDDIWSTDGTAEGTKNLSETLNFFIISDIRVVGDKILIEHNNGGFEPNTEIWFLDKDDDFIKIGVYTTVSKSISNGGFHVINDLCFFDSRSIENSGITELWVTDGTKAGSKKLVVSDSTYEIKLTDYNTDKFSNHLVFKIINDDNDVSGLWISDGTELGTFDLKDLGVELDNIYHIELIGELKGKFIFKLVDRDYYESLWSTDGTQVGTSKLGGYNSYWNDHVLEQSFTKLNGYYYYVFQVEIGEYQIWRTDGTLDNTEKIVNLPNKADNEYYNITIHQVDNHEDLFYSTNQNEDTELFRLQPDYKEISKIISVGNESENSTQLIGETIFVSNVSGNESSLNYLSESLDKLEVIAPLDISNAKPYDEMVLHEIDEYKYFFADYYDEGVNKLYRIETPYKGISSVEDSGDSEISFYPNPTNDNLHIGLMNRTDIEIIDINGKPVIKLIDFDGGNVDVSGLVNGFYSITNQAGKQLGRFIKQGN